MPADLVSLHLRRPEKRLPVEVLSALGEAESICATADRLTGEVSGIGHFAELLADDLRQVLFPGVRFERRRKEAADPGKALDPEVGAILS
jgi:hypothetical protein